MNGQQIEEVLRLIDGNIDLTRGEVADYIRSHQDAVVTSLIETGSATIMTSAGKVHIAMDDLKAVLA